MWPKINKDLLPMKGHYFLYNAGIAPVQPFMPTYAKSLGFKSDVVGTIYAILPFTGMLAKPFFGAVADRYRLHKFIFMFFQLVTIISFFSIQFIPSVPVENTTVFELICSSETNFHVNISGVGDSCIIERVNQDSQTENSVKCSMTCRVTPALENEICYHWKEDIPLCFNGSDVGNLKNHITASFSKTSKWLDSGKEVFYEEKSKGFSMDREISFNAIVNLEHTEQISHIMYFRVSTLILENNNSRLAYCLGKTITNCNVECEPSSLADLLSTVKETKSSDVNWYQLLLLLLFLVLSWVGMAVVGSISDAICFEILGAKAGQYGRQRLWGSVGWGIFAFLTGLIIDKFSKGYTEKNYTPIFYIMLVMLLCDFACMYSLKNEQTKLSTQIFRNVGGLLKNIKVDIFLLWCILFGILIGIQWNFLFWFVEELVPGGNCSTKDWMKTLQGLMNGIQCFLGELPSFFFSGWILKKFGHVNVMTGTLFILGIRFVLYSYVKNPWWCLPIEVLQCGVGLSFATMASYASIVAPPGTEATVQGLVGATFEGIGVSLGSLLGGIIFKKYGGGTCFRIFGLMALVAGVLHTALQYVLSRATGFKLNGKDFNGIAKYASPTDAVSMLEDT